ncbi:MAG: sugar phosphate isomerase/epimerase family protein [Planctomycetota bacterium]
MKLGLNVFLWSGQTDEKLFPILEKIKGWGYDGAEFPLFHANEDVYRRVREKLDELGLGATGCTVCTAQANLISDSADVRKAGVEHLSSMLRMCKVLGAEILCGPVAPPLGQLVGRGRTREEWNRAVEGLREVARVAEETGTTVAVEAVNRFETYFVNTAADLRALVEEVNHPRIRMMFDTFHANIEEKDIYEALKSCDGLLAHVHISENDRGIPGTGRVPWDEVGKALRELGYEGWVTIESFGQAVPEIAAAAAIWRPLFASNDEVGEKGVAFLKARFRKRSPRKPAKS